MTDLILIDAESVVRIHDSALKNKDLRGMAGGKSLEGALARVDTRILYDQISDWADLCAAYAVAVARAHCFNDGNKRTAFRVMSVVAELNAPGQMSFDADPSVVGDVIVRVARGDLDEGELASLIRDMAQRSQPFGFS